MMKMTINIIIIINRSQDFLLRGYTHRHSDVCRIKGGGGLSHRPRKFLSSFI